MKIGIVTAMYEETKPLYQKLSTTENVKTEIIAGMNIFITEYRKHSIYLINSGIGEIRATIATQILIGHYKVERILNFGFVGALSDKFKINDLAIVDKVVHYHFDLEKINGTPKGQYNNRQGIFFDADKDIVKRIQKHTNLNTVILASGDEFIAESEKKKGLVKRYKADICDMEMAGIALTCEQNNIPYASIKVVSDNANEEADQSFEETVSKGITKYEEILTEVIENL